MTASIGAVALASGSPIPTPDLIELADAALYNSKRAGRNRVTVANPAGDRSSAG